MPTTIRDYMSSEISPIQGDTSLIEAAQQMRVSGVGGIPVVDPDGGKCVGILTGRDVVVRVLAEERDPRTAVVRDVATLRPVIATPTTTSRPRWSRCGRRRSNTCRSSREEVWSG